MRLDGYIAKMETTESSRVLGSEEELREQTEMLGIIDELLIPKYSKIVSKSK